MAEIEGPYSLQVYLAYALDPVHVGTGEHKLERVDNPIIREPETNLPKIPATSISGALRSYTVLYYSDKFMRSGEKRKPANCAEDIKLQFCAQPTCPVCVTYGFPEGTKGKRGFSSMAQVFDAHLLFFPVHTMVGPAWVTSASTLREAIDAEVLADEDVNIKLAPDSNTLQTTLRRDRLNLGWFLLRVEDGTCPLNPSGRDKLAQMGVPSMILDRLILTSDKLFTHVVNSNLEVRTSTAIDPITGSSKEGALFTYEAVPRSTIFWFSVIYKDPRNFKMNGEKIEYDIDWVRENVEKGLSYYEYLGVGGMVTRGMGRLKILNLK